MSVRTRGALAGLCLALAAAHGVAARADTADEGAAPAGGLLSRIVEWFRSDDAAAAPAQAPEPAAPEATSAPAEAPATLGDVHAAVRDAIAEIALLRAATGVGAAPTPREGRRRPRGRDAGPRPRPGARGARQDRAQRTPPRHGCGRTLRARPSRASPPATSTARRAPSSGSFAASSASSSSRPPSSRPRRRPPARRPLRSTRSLRTRRRSSTRSSAGPPSLNDVMGCVAQIHDELRAVAAGLGAALPGDAPAPAAAQRASCGGCAAAPARRLQGHRPSDRARHGGLGRAGGCARGGDAGRRARRRHRPARRGASHPRALGRRSCAPRGAFRWRATRRATRTPPHGSPSRTSMR